MDEAAKNIILVDDDPINNLICRKKILKARPNTIIQEFLTARKGLDYFLQKPTPHVDLLLLDINMPDLDAWRFLDELQNNALRVPVIIITSSIDQDDLDRAKEYDVIINYIIKPIKPRVLISRLKAILRRNTAEGPSSETMVFPDLKIDRESFSVTYLGKVLQFPKKEFELLSLLASKPGKVFTREFILEKVWGDEVLVVDRTIDVHIRKLREKIGDDFIGTVKGVGYKFEI